MVEAWRPQIVFTDVDGTLVDDDHHPRPQDGSTMQAVVAAGVSICLVSARHPAALRTIHDQLGFSGPIVCYSGAYVLDEDGAELLSLTIPVEEALEIRSFVEAELADVVVCTYGFEDWIVDDRSDPSIREEEFYVQVEAEECRDLAARFAGRGIHKFMLRGRPEQISAAEAAIAGRYPQLCVVRSNQFLCEIMRGGVSKLRAVELLLARFGFERSDAVAFGDGLNDLDMLRGVDESYAMPNGFAEVREAAAHVAGWPNTDGGVAKTLASLILG